MSAMNSQQQAFEAWYGHYAACRQLQADGCDRILRACAWDAWHSGFYYGYIDKDTHHGSIKGTDEGRHGLWLHADQSKKTPDL